jgi:tape measure domain-containing protein
MAVSNVELIVNAVKAINPLRQVGQQSKKLEQALSLTQRTMSNLGRVAERAGKAIRVTFDRAAKSAVALQKKLSGVRGALAGIGASALTSRMISQSASFKQVEIRLSVLSKQYGEFSRIQELVSKNAKTFNQSQAESASNFADAYARLRPLGISLDEIQTVYEGFNATALASGTSAVAASGAFLQLSQALGSGRLQGDEFRSIAEQVPGILRLVADEMGVTVGALKQFGSEGKITSDILINALAKGFEQNKDKIQELLDLSPAQKFKNFNNAVSELSNTIGSELLPVVTPLVDAGTETVKIFGRLPAPLKTATAALFGLGAGFTAAAAGANLLGISLTKAGLVKLAALSGKIALFTAPFLGLALAFEDAQRRKEALDNALESNSLNEVQDALNGSIQELNELIDGLQVIEKTPYFKGQTAEIQRLKKQVEEAADKVDELTKRRDLIVDLKVNVPFLGKPGTMGAGFADELKDELEKLGLDYTPGKEVKPLKKKTQGKSPEQAAAQAERQRLSFLKQINAEINRINEAELDGLEAGRQIVEQIDAQGAAEIKRGETNLALLQAKIDGRLEEEQLAQKIKAIEESNLNDVQKKKQISILNQTQALKEQIKLREKDPLVKMQRELDALLDKQNQAHAAATAIGNSFSNAFTSIIQGTKSADQAIADMLSSVAEHFMDMAAQIIAKQLAMIAYGLIMKALGVGLNSGGGGGFEAAPLGEGFSTGATPSSFDAVGAGLFAEGGYVSGPTRAVIGEGGESEYVIPESKMRESMARYSRGARGSAVIPEAGGSGTVSKVSELFYWQTDYAWRS